MNVAAGNEGKRSTCRLISLSSVKDDARQLAETKAMGRQGLVRGPKRDKR